MSEKDKNIANWSRWLNNDLSESAKTEFEESEKLDGLSDALEEIDTWLLPVFETESGYKALKNKLHQKPERKVIWLKIYQMAAALLLPFALFVGYKQWMSLDIILVAANDSNLEYYLPDSSKVVISPYASIEFNKDSYLNARDVTLEGEAHFEVKKGNPFVVSTEFGQVEVLGTSFLVLSEPEIFKVNCYSGVVSVDYKEWNQVIRQSQGVVYKSTDSVNVPISLVNFAWENDHRSYYATSIEDILIEVNRFYNIDIQVPNSIGSQKYTGRLPLKSLENTLAILFGTMGIEYTLDNDKTVTFH